MRPVEDNYRYKGLRKKLVDEVASKGITSNIVLDAMMKIPRHFFLDSAFDTNAYEDKAFPIGEGQTISQPYTVAYQSQLLDCKPLDKVLEIGTGSGYQASILSAMGVKVFTIERQKILYEKNKNFPFLQSLPNIKFFYGDGYEGLPTYAPFDKVIITAAAPYIPQPLLDQMKIGGIMVIPLDEGTHQRMHRITKISQDDFKDEKFELFSFVPMIEGRTGNGG
ncbi:MAG: protein-L-isoaspartate(D-aspartate) O-methyltransferase [Chitinophagaceae bacterium]